MEVITAQARIVEMDELVKRVAALEGSPQPDNLAKVTTPPGWLSKGIETSHRGRV